MSSKPVNTRADILVIGPDEKPILLVEVKRRKFDQPMLRQIGEFAGQISPAFVMVVDLREILVAPVFDGIVEWAQATELSTPKILRDYAETESFDRVEGFYLESLTEAWLRDFTHGWKSARP